jgi:hypothetical protein
MSRNERKSVKIHYRHFDDVNGAFGGVSLQDSIERSLHRQGQGASGILSDVKNRHFDADKSYGTVILNYTKSLPAGFFAQFVRFEPGADIPLVHTDEDGGSSRIYELKQASCPEGHAPLRGYFICFCIKIMLLY